MAEDTRRFHDMDLRGARFTSCELTGAVMRGVVVDDMEIDSPWLLEGGSTLMVNGVDVAPYVDQELNRRFPGREQRRAGDAAGMRRAWEAVQRTWADTMARAAAMPEGTVDASVGGEWSFARTLRHLVMATDVWLGQAILGEEQPYHRFGQPIPEFEAEGHDMSVFDGPEPTYAEVLEVRAGRVDRVRAFLAAVTAEQLDEPRQNPWAPQHPETVRSCLHTIFEEEWEHHRYAVRDLDALEADPGSAAGHGSENGRGSGAGG